MNYLITGGTRGLGKHLVETFSGDSISRTENQLDITKEHDQAVIALKSLDYDVFINNAFDGPPHEQHANFAQTTLLWKVYETWKTNDKRGYIFNIGSSGSKSVVAPNPMFETYRSSKAALEFASKQCTKAFKDNLVPFRTTLITLDRLDTELTRSRASWTGNGINLNDVSDFIKYAVDTNENTVIEDVVLYVNLNYGKN
jgi:NAD(P)-dependent dehydrogenase (short-subunit alcohol dehydrogenase family)